jgi:hypothetical protein
MTNSVDMASLILQIVNLEMLFKDFNNTDLMQKLNIIVEQNQKIMKLLEGRENNG